MAPDPKTLVITFCPNDPTAIANTPCIRFLFGKNITLPPYSPMRFGVNTAQVNPQKTDSIAFHTDIGDKTRVRCRHFKDSSTQLSIINSTTSNIVTNTLL
ncbi:MAG: hypothetical protein JWP44_3038 [Mucilaginibacter sp.]|nr:hypothetical protein [Mucilaginibacter sp.]